MKKFFFTSAFFIFICTSLFAQNLPKISRSDYGFSENVKSVTTSEYYKDDDAPRKISGAYYYFGSSGNIDALTMNKPPEDKVHKVTLFTYENERLVSEKLSHRDKSEDYTIIYQYGEKGLLKNSNYTSKYLNLDKQFFYKADKLSKVTTSAEMGRAEEEYFYNKFGNLYAIHDAETVENGTENIVVLFQDNKEIAKYSSLKSKNVVLNYITDNIEISYATSDDLIKKELKDLESFLNVNQPTSSDLAQKIKMILKKSKKIELQKVKFYIRNSYGDLKAAAELETPFEELKKVTFYKTEYLNGEIAGGIEFSENIFAELQKLFDETKSKGLLKTE